MNSDHSTRFPFILHEVLESANELNFECIISWVPNSDSFFIVHKPKEFEQFIMKRYFLKQNHYKSFLRQLNIYGFARVVSKRNDPASPPNGAYGHPLFVRGKPDLCFLMDRPKARKSLICNTNDSRHGVHCSLMERACNVQESRLVELSSMQGFGKPILGLATVPAASHGRTTYPTMSHILVNESGNVIPDNLVDDIIEVFGSRATVPPAVRSASADCPAQTHLVDKSVLLPKEGLDPTLAQRSFNESARPSLSNDPVDEV
jgi:HSF-type DNA-binding